MTDLDKVNTEQLAIELAARQAQAEREQTEREQRLDEARKAWDREFVDSHAERDEALLAETNAHRGAFAAAVAVGDLPAAYAAWIGERRCRYARTSLRDTLAAAAAGVGEECRLPPLAYRDPDLLRRLEEDGDKAARLAGYDVADQIAGERPTVG